MSGPLLSFSSEELTLSRLREALQHAKACLIKHFPIEDHDHLQSKVLEWGTPVLEPRNLKGGMIYTVSVDDQSDLPAYANTPYAFGLHTDCSEFETPPDTVLLLCEQAAESGGESIVVDLDRIIPYLDFETLLQLQKPQFYFKPALRNILSLNTQQDIEVRYQPAHFVLGEQLNLWQKTAAQQQALDTFEAALAQEAVSFLLQPGEALLLNNRRCLHGRRAFRGQRKLKRVRFNLQS